MVCALLPVAASPVKAASPVIEAAAGAWPGSPQTWSMNLYREGAVRYQNPDYRACTAAAAMSMLNLIAYSTDETLPTSRGSASLISLRWQVDTSYGRQEDILTFERDHMTMYGWADGSDPHGWRNALNWYGWGSLDAGVYRDASFKSFTDAAWSVVVAIARTHKPVGILAWSGSHAQFVTGYKVTGADPRVSDNFTIDAVYLTDPLAGDGIRNKQVSYATWRSGPGIVRFGECWQRESPARDPIDGQIGDRDWWGKFVIIEPVV
jgi:hypothetical protein